MRPARDTGFSLVEVLVALFLLQIALLSLAPMFMYATKSTASAGDIGSVGAAATDRMEQLAQTDFDTLTAGGSLTSNVTGFFDSTDPDVRIRWQITDDATPPTLKTVQVWVQARRDVLGLPKSITLTTVMAEE